MKSNRYSTQGLIETEYESDSHNRVLKNLPGIKSKRVLDQKEAEALAKAQEWALGYFSAKHRFTETDIRKIHKAFLGRLYAWAGDYRRVNLQKGSFPFAPASEVPRLMTEFSRNVLARYTPCLFKEQEQVIEAVGIVHVELVIIHPFREGNGRLARLLADLMVLQAGLPSLDFGFIRGRVKQEYFKAIQQGLKRNYEPIKKLMAKALQRGFRGVAG